MKRAYHNWIQAYVQHTRYSESPDSFHFWTAVATVAGALRRRVWIDQRHFQWTPNFYIVLVGPPGVAAKSTSIRGGLSLLEKIPGVYFGPQSMTWQALTESLQNAQESVEITGLVDPAIMSCLTIGVSELGTFLRPEDKELVDVLVAMWDGQKEAWRRTTRTQGETIIQNPWLNVIGCTTPAWLKNNFPDVLIGGGLTSRMVFVFADRKRQLVAYPADFIASADYEQEETYLIHDLQQIADLKGEYCISPEAKIWGEEWYELHWTATRPTHMASDRFSGYIARKQTHIHKLAIVLASAKRSHLVIEKEDLVEANNAIVEIEADMEKVFSSIGVMQGARVSTEILQLVKNHKVIEYQRLWQLCFSTMASKDFQDSVKAALEAGFVKIEIEGNKKYLRYIGHRPILPDAGPPKGKGP